MSLLIDNWHCTVANIFFVLLFALFGRFWWVHSKRMAYYNQVNAYLMWRIQQDDRDFSLEEVDAYFDTLWPEAQMIFAIGEWDLGLMVYDKKRYDEVVGWSRNY